MKDLNKAYQTSNKFVVAFLSSLQCTSDAEKTEMINQWKLHSPKLKSQLKKNATGIPKRVVSKYLFFCQEEREKIFQENPSITIKECTCELGKRWSKFKDDPDPERMKRLDVLFLADKQRYDSEKAESVQKKRPAPKSAYLAFCREQRNKGKISMKELGEMWTDVKTDPKELERYQKLAEE